MSPAAKKPKKQKVVITPTPYCDNCDGRAWTPHATSDCIRELKTQISNCMDEIKSLQRELERMKYG